ncbi:GTP-binding protein YPTC5-like [Xenia sp. Carnegie-2017]|uniref:GTP-binding protein YPTC5-like n=1 Tax=Xenia sp. Carnegie-2017 TaxID=2897299 RepID=UPI001F044BCA|nr:GTP-binding protein YPTC5-like [Xenia sp. Carnegie-2017]
MEEFRQLKASGKLPFNQLPILEVDDKILAQTPTIIRYLGRETGFAPINSFDIAKADMIGDALTDTLQKAHKAYLEDEELKVLINVADFGVDDNSKLTLWDTAGEERFKSLTSQFYRKADAAIIVFDLTFARSFNEAKDY